MRRIAAILLALSAETTPAADADHELALGKALFSQSAVPACGICHTLNDAGTSGQIGPPLDELKPSTERVVAALRNGIGMMPSYRDTLTEAQIQALARYVSTVSQGPLNRREEPIVLPAPQTKTPLKQP